MTQGPLHDAIVERWGADIASGRRPAGSRIITDQAVVEFSASRSAIREAVRVLESLGMVESRQRVGITVLPVESWSPYDPRILRWRLDGPDRAELLRSLSELRAAVEPAAARLAAERATPAQCGALAAAVIGMASTSRAADADEYLAHDIAFHTVLLEASGNVMLASLGTIVVAVLEGRTHHALMPAVADAEALRLHGLVAAAVQSGDGSAAEEAMRAIVAESLTAMSAGT
ncbi:FadR/GntR family transcriptional regulator [Microbacterium ulmi]|uniref:FadR family transcriptional regulator n=1 Tax=Microbacterium ulmi TaxID=179095 RepID=A0A7Y2M2U3_9MICO|nr:FCD domain-containing protein [Microbacterium ulmi]NII69318.1 DNA-binding FadR family transcriptional regulator [Microbacterium ulmi]NNH04068.1 FadR family transcriptional regulator [Microbacterium ulmi]